MAHTIKYVNFGSWEHPATIDAEGNVVVDWTEMDFLDVDETSVWCEDCGNQISPGDGVHNLNEEWQAL